MLRCFRYLFPAVILFAAMTVGCVPINLFHPGTIPRQITFLISSNTVSNFTPCGCHSGKWGGMPRRGSIFAQTQDEVAKKPKPWPVLQVDTGDVSQGSTNGIQAKKDDYIFQSYKVMKYDAVAVGMSDLRLGADALKKYGTDDSVPWIACNVFQPNVFPALPDVTPPANTQPQNPQPPVGGPTTVPPATTTPGQVPPPGSPTPPPTPAPSSGNAQAATPPSGAANAGGQGTPSAGANNAPPSKDPIFATSVIVTKPEAPGFKIAFIGAMVQDNTRLNTVQGYSFQPYNDAIEKEINRLRGSEKVDFIVLVCDSDDIDLDQQLSQQVKDGIDMCIGGRVNLPVSPNATADPYNSLYVSPKSTSQTEPATNPNQAAPQKTDDEIVDSLNPIPKPFFIQKAQPRGRLVTRLDIVLNSSGKNRRLSIQRYRK